jgi:hypothetical protein
LLPLENLATSDFGRSTTSSFYDPSYESEITTGPFKVEEPVKASAAQAWGIISELTDSQSGVPEQIAFDATQMNAAATAKAVYRAIHRF